MTMKYHRNVLLLLLFTTLSLAACGGGGASAPPSGPSAAPSGAPSATATPAALPTPIASPVSTYVFHIVTLTSTSGLAAYNTTTPALPTGTTLGSPVPNAILTYPDGSTQTADASGTLLASASSYATTHALVVQTSGGTAPFVRLADPLSASSGGGTLSASTTSGQSARFAGITVAPNGDELFSGQNVTLVAQATTLDDLVTVPSGSVTHWSSSVNASILPTDATGTQVVYVAPSVNVLTTDIVTATFTPPGSSLVFSAQSYVTILPTANAVSVSGTVTGATGNLAADFFADDAIHVFPSYNFFTSVGNTGTYSNLLLPPNQEFFASILATSSGVTTASPASVNGNGQAFSSGSSSTAVADLAPLGQPFGDARDDAKNAPPDPIVSTRDAWEFTQVFASQPFWADSGILSILAAPPNLNAGPTIVGTGILADWCYQWTLTNGVTSLAIIENTSASCSNSTSGTTGYLVTPQSVSNSYTFTEFRHVTGGYAVNAALTPSSGSVQVLTGSWSQALTQNGGAISGDTASVTISLLGPISQAAGNLAQEQVGFAYSYSVSNGVATTVLSNVAMIDPTNNLPLASAQTIAFTPQGSAGACAGLPRACYSFAGTVTRIFNLSSGAQTQAFAINGVLNGDGSLALTMSTTGTGSDLAATFLPIGSASTRAQGSCVVCLAQPGSSLDQNGSSQVGQLTVSSSGIATFSQLATQEGPDAPSPTIVGVRIFGL